MKSKVRPVAADFAAFVIPIALTLFTFHLFWMLLIVGYFLGVVAQALAEES
jgi:hypothetical protein